MVLSESCEHACSIVARGTHAPAPTFRIVAADRPDAPLEGKSASACWSAVLARCNAEIVRRRAAGEALPPPPKTAIAGPEYHGLNSPEAVAAIEALDPQHRCAVYWQGRAHRAQQASALERDGNSGKGGRKRRRGAAKEASSDEEDTDSD